MWAYTVRRFLLLVPTVLGIMLLTFVLFDCVAPNPAVVLAGKFKSKEQIAAIAHKYGFDKPRWFNTEAAHKEGFWHLFDSQFFDVLTFRFPNSVRYQESVWTLFARKAPVSLAIQLPVFIVLLGMQLALGLFVASRRGKPTDFVITTLAVLGMSLPGLSIYLGAQWFFGAYLRWFPVAGWSTNFRYAVHFAALPIMVSVIGGLGGGTRFFRTVTLEEINAEYVRTARAKGVSRSNLLLIHVLRNVMIPVVTGAVVALPLLFTGALILEHLFQIPGFGGLLVDSIFGDDQPVVMAIVYVTSIIYMLALLATDICYAWVDPRVVLR